MPTFRPVLGTVGIRIQARWASHGQVAMLRPNVGIGGTPSDADCGDINNVVQTWAEDVYAPLICEGWNIFRIQTFSMEEDEGPISDQTANFNGGQLYGDGVNLPEWAPLTLLGAGSMGYGNHGRIFNLAPANDVITSDNYTTVHLLALAGAWVALDEALQALSPSYKMAIARPAQGNSVPVKAFAYSTFFSTVNRRRNRPTT